MNNNTNTKKIFISGGGDAKDSFLLDKEFINSITGIKSILYIPTAMEVDLIGYEACYDWIINTLGAHSNEFINITMWTDLKEKTQKELNKFNAIYIGGGNTFRLLQQIYDSNFLPLLLKYINRGGIVYGGSAGAIIMGKNINIVQEENNKHYKYSKGLAMIGNYTIICHYKNDIDKKIINYIEQYNNPIIALTEKTGLKIENSQATVIGYEPATIFDLNKKKEIIKNNTHFNLYENQK